MAINYNFIVGNVTKKLQYGELSDVIIRVSFGVNAYTDDTEPAQFTYSCSGSKDLSIEELDGENFIDFENVTSETIVSWLLDSENVDSLDEFSYVKASVNNIRDRIAELQVQTDTLVPGDSSFSGSVSSGYQTSEPQ